MAYVGVVLLVFSQASLFSLTVKKKLTVNGSYKMLPNLAVRRRMSVRRFLLMFGAIFSKPIGHVFLGKVTEVDFHSLLFPRDTLEVAVFLPRSSCELQS